jgi:hypothetical protein
LDAMATLFFSSRSVSTLEQQLGAVPYRAGFVHRVAIPWFPRLLWSMQVVCLPDEVAVGGVQVAVSHGADDPALVVHRVGERCALVTGR